MLSKSPRDGSRISQETTVNIFGKANKYQQHCKLIHVVDTSY